MKQIMQDVVKIVTGSGAMALGAYVGFQTPDYYWKENFDRMQELSQQPGVRYYKGKGSLATGGDIADVLSNMPLYKSGSDLGFYSEKAKQAEGTIESTEAIVESHYNNAHDTAQDYLQKAEKIRKWVPEELVKKVPKVGDELSNSLAKYDQLYTVIAESINYVDTWKVQQADYVEQYKELEAKHATRKKWGAGIGATAGLMIVLLAAAGIRRNKDKQPNREYKTTLDSKIMPFWLK